MLQVLTAISPIDGRYHKQTSDLSNYFSEFALIKYRVLIEIEYFILLYEQGLPQLVKHPIDVVKLRDIYKKFSIADAESIKQLEKTTNHDVKAVEYFIKECLESMQMGAVTEFVHFGLTSQDINNTAIPLSIKEALEQVILPSLKIVIDKIEEQANAWDNVPMLARTHGQPASPTRLGKELMVFVSRLQEQLRHLKSIPHSAKFGGATGNFNAHHVAYPHINWFQFGNTFCTQLGLSRSNPTTQIEHYDNMAAMFDALKRINTILIDLSRDIWQYIAMDYFKQELKKGEIGSSAMPHKVNPIDFENAEGNLGMANAIFEHLSAKLPISRLQRDLTDSTVLRNVGVPLAHSLIAFTSLTKGLNKLLINKAKIEADLDNNWAVVAEAIQTVLRREGYPQPYEALKALTRTNEKIDSKSIHTFISMLAVSEDVRKELLNITPFNYTGI